MGRSFDGVDDYIGFGAGTAFNNLTTKAVTAWVNSSATASQQIFGKFDPTVLPASGWQFLRNITNNRLRLTQTWSTADGAWAADSVFTNNVRVHVAFTYDQGNVANDPVFYANGVAQSLALNSNGTGTTLSDAAQEMRIGASNNAGGDFSGLMAHISYTDVILTATEVNRARWWGRPNGAVLFYQPLMTDKLTNEGTGGAATGTANGTTMASFATPVNRPGTAMMGAIMGF